MRVLRYLWSIILLLPKSILVALDWIVGVLERLVVITIVLMAFYVGWLAFHGTTNQADRSAFVTTLTTLSDNWKPLLLLLIPLFYRTVRTFLEKVRKFAGMETDMDTEQKRTPYPNQGE